MLFNRTLLLICLFLFHLSGISAQEKAEDISSRFFELFQEKGSDAAVDYIFSTNKWLDNDKSTVDAIKMQLKKGIAIIGQYYGYELIEKKSLGDSYVLLSYMLRYDRQPIKVVFILYTPGDLWQIQNLKFDDRLDDDIENLKN